MPRLTDRQVVSICRSSALSPYTSRLCALLPPLVHMTRKRPSDLVAPRSTFALLRHASDAAVVAADSRYLTSQCGGARSRRAFIDDVISSAVHTRNCRCAHTARVSPARSSKRARCRWLSRSTLLDPHTPRPQRRLRVNRHHHKRAQRSVESDMLHGHTAASEHVLTNASTPFTFVHALGALAHTHPHSHTRTSSSRRRP